MSTQIGATDPTAALDASAGVIGLLRARMPSLTPHSQRLARQILANPADVIHLTVTDLAESVDTSVATVVRFCQDLGLKGYQDLKLRLAAETVLPGPEFHEDVAETDPPSEVLAKVMRNSAAAITDAQATLDGTQFAAAADVLAHSDHILFAGVGTSAPLAQDAAHRFRTAGLRTEWTPDIHGQHVSARLLTKSAACIAISHTGQTRETLAVVAAARQAGAATIAITSFLRSPLTNEVDVALVAGSRETNFRVEAMASRIAHLAVLDALFVAVCIDNLPTTTASQELTAQVITEHRI